MFGKYRCFTCGIDFFLTFDTVHVIIGMRIVSGHYHSPRQDKSLSARFSFFMVLREVIRFLLAPKVRMVELGKREIARNNFLPLGDAKLVLLSLQPESQRDKIAR